MDCFDEEFASLLGEDFANIPSPVMNNSSSSFFDFINLPIRSNITDNTTITQPPQIRSNITDNTTITQPPQIALSSHFPVLSEVTSRSFDKEKSSQVLKRTSDRSTDTSEVELTYEDGVSKSKKRKSRVRPPSQTYDHIIAERKRRELQGQQFVALSALVPGLKKMDKTSILGNAIKHMKHLKERVKTMEEQAAKLTLEPMVLVNKSQVTVEDGFPFDKRKLPDIEARVSNRSILLKIQCQRCKGILVAILTEVEKLNLTVLSTRAAPLGILALEITIIAQMEQEFDSSAEDITKTLRSALWVG